MRAFIINLNSAPDRWTFVAASFASTGFVLERIAAVDGQSLQLPITEYAERNYRRFHGRPTSRGAIGCYLSHLQAMRAFLATGDSHALIAEDDITLGPRFEEVTRAAAANPGRWDIVRLSGLAAGRGVKVAALTSEHSLRVGLTRLKGTGAYLINRTAATALSQALLPMWLPIDHALDREWHFGLRAAFVQPFPATQTESGFRSQIQRGHSAKLPTLHRLATTYPYQVRNELERWISRTCQILAARFRTQPGTPAN